MPVSGALDPEPVDVAVLVDIGQPGYLGILGMTVIDQRMDLRLPEPASECRQFSGAEILVTKHQYRVFGEGVFDPGEGLGIQRLRYIHAERLGTERFAERTKF